MKTPVALTLRGMLCAFAAVCAISVSQADENKDTKEKKTPPGILKKYDLNNDGKLDETEQAALDADKAKKKADEAAKRLEKYDVNKDGKLDESEKAAAKADKKAMDEKKKAEREKKKAEKDAAGSAPVK